MFRHTGKEQPRNAQWAFSVDTGGTVPMKADWFGASRKKGSPENAKYFLGQSTVGLSRVGIYAGTFNPVHTGHIAFALQSIKTAKLDMVYFLPERRPRHKKGVEHFAHRVAMLKTAVRPHPQLAVLETDDVSFTVQRTLPKLQDELPGSQLVFLMGSDIVPHIASWPLAHRLFEQAELVVGMRKDDELADILALAQTWSPQPIKLTLLQSYAPDVSSHKVREALAGRQYAKGLLTSVARYSEHHWLYVSLSKVLLDKA